MQTILIFIDWFFPGYRAGGPIQSVANMVDHLGDRYRFMIVTRDSDYTHSLPYATVKSDEWNEFRPGTMVYYFSKENLDQVNLRKVINDVQFDAVYINGIYSWHFSILPLMILKRDPVKKIVAPRGMLSRQALGVKGIKKRMFLLLAKTKGLYRDILFQSTSEQETLDIKKQISSKAKIFEASNFPKRARQNERRLVYKKPGELRLVNIARVSPEKNNMYAISSLKGLKDMDIILDIYGPVYDQAYFELCKAEARKLPDTVQVNFKGPAQPSELELLITKYHFLLFPSTGENFGHAIYESLSVGVPVIISDQTPWRNLAAVSAGWDLPLEDKDKWTAILKKCYDMDQEEYNILCSGAHRLAQKYVEESDFMAKYERLFG